MRSLAKFRGTACLNCNTPLDVADRHCHQCGQLNTTKRLALKDFFNEFFSNIISYDSRLWRTITQLIIRPGFVTLEYCAGKRTVYANPFRFFLTVSIVFFLLLQVLVQFSEVTFKNDDPNRNSNDLFNVSVNNDSLNKTELLALLKNEDSLLGNQGLIQKKILENAIKELEKDSVTSTREKAFITQKELDNKWYVAAYFKQLEAYDDYIELHPNDAPEDALKNMKHRLNNTNKTRFKKAQNLNDLSENPSEVINILLPKMPLFLFFFAPILSLFFWLVYARGSWNYMEHMVFNFHLFTFIFLMLYLIVIENELLGTSVIGYIFFGIIGPIYLYKAMRTFYGQRRLKTILKFFFINFVFLVLLSLGSTFFILGSILVSV